MENLSIISWIFIFCLLLGPLLMSRDIKNRKYYFLIINIGLFALILSNIQSAAAIILFVFIPYIYIIIIKKYNISIWPIIIIQISGFIYLNQYTWVINSIGIEIPQIIRLLGISYILFRQIDVLMQVKAKLVDDVPVVDYLNYLFSFWTLLAGPIQRYREFIQSFYVIKPIIKDKETLLCFHRAANGFLKILVLGSFFKFVADDSYAYMVGGGYSLKFLILIFYCYPLYVYFNFSGYCDIVIAMGKWAGFDLPENFNRPYLSRDMIEMWNRWHITMSQWFRDYLYQPLFKYLLKGPLEKRIMVAQYVSIFITFFVVGMWHGTTVNFIVFGLLQGGGMAVSMIYRDFCKNRMGKTNYQQFYNKKWVQYTERFFTLNFWCFTFLFVEYDVGKIIIWLLKSIGV